MEIKQFKVLSTVQKRELYNFIKRTDLTYNKTYIEMLNIYESNTFDDGNSMFIQFHKEEIVGSAAVITKEISIKGEAFITDIYVANKDIGEILFFLMERIVEYCNICNAESMKVGIRESEMHLIPFIEAMEFSHVYDAKIMRCNGEKYKACKEYKGIELQPLSILNSCEYMNIQNEAFKNSPNGATIDEVEVKDYVIQYANNEDLIGLCLFEKRACGIYELSIDGNIGWINTLGIHPSYQKKGIGRLLIAKCIEKLHGKKIDEIKLLVITSNEVAVAMYKQIGFEEEKVFSYWFERSINHI